MVQYGTIADPLATMTMAQRTGDEKCWTVNVIKDAYSNETHKNTI